MQIDIAPETARLVREEIINGRVCSADEIVKAGLQALREKYAPADSSTATTATGKQKARAFVEWAKGHPYTPPLSDEAISRASLNPDR